MKLFQIRHVVAVAERGDLSSGAEALGVSPHALMRSIRELERELGAALFKRGRKPMSLTTAGQTFVRRASMALLELDHAAQEVRQFRGVASELVRVEPDASAHPTLLLPS